MLEPEEDMAIKLAETPPLEPTAGQEPGNCAAQPLWTQLPEVVEKLPALVKQLPVRHRPV